MAGRFCRGCDQIAEAETIAAATGTRFAPYGALLLAGLRGAETEAAPLIQAVLTDARAAGQGGAVQVSHWASAILYNGLGRYEKALAEAQQAAEQAPDCFLHVGAARAGRGGQQDRPDRAGRRRARPAGRGHQRRPRPTGGRGSRRAAGRCSATARTPSAATARRSTGWAARRLRPELARAHLLYGEWLRRERRRADAREQLRTAHEMFAAIGMEAFAERARRELVATGETARQRTVEDTRHTRSARGADSPAGREGRRTPRSGPACSSDPRTVEYHLRKVYGKLDISSRHQLKQRAARQRPRRADGITGIGLLPHAHSRVMPGCPLS